MTNVLLIGSWGPPYLTFARSLHRRRIGVYLLEAGEMQRDPQKYSSALLGSDSIEPGLIGTPEGVDAIVRYARRIRASALTALNDHELVWLGEQRGAFEPWCRVLVPPPETLAPLLSKCRQLDLARSSGLDALPTYLLTHVEDTDLIPESAYPLALRPDREEDVKPGFKVRLGRSPADLRAVMRGCHVVRSPIIAQPFQCLPNLVVHAVRSENGDIISTRCYVAPRKFEGLTLSIEPCPFPAGLERRCGDFASRAGITGCYHFDFLFSPTENRAYFLEVNIRMGGTTDKVMQTGFDEPALMLQAYGVISTQPSDPDSRYGRVVNKRTLLKHIVWAAKGKLTDFDYPNVSRARHVAYSLRDLLLAKDSVFDWQDLRGSLWYHLRKSDG